MESRSLFVPDGLAGERTDAAIAKLLDTCPDEDLAKHFKAAFYDELIGKGDLKRSSDDIPRSCILALGKLAEPNEKGSKDAKISEALADYYQKGKDQQATYFALNARSTARDGIETVNWPLLGSTRSVISSPLQASSRLAMRPDSALTAPGLTLRCSWKTPMSRRKPPQVSGFMRMLLASVRLKLKATSAWTSVPISPAASHSFARCHCGWWTIM